MDGVFTLPYTPITPALDPSYVYHFDNIATGPNGEQVPQCKNYRFWGYQATPFMQELNNNGLRISD